MSFLSSLFKKKSEPIDAQFNRYLNQKYGLETSETEGWRLIYGSTKLASRKVKLFRVYNPAKLADVTSRPSYDELSASPEAVMFEGQISSNGDVGQFRDVRPGAKPQL